VALTKADLASPERVAEVETRDRRTLLGTGLAGAEIVPVSVVSGEGIDAAARTPVRAPRQHGRARARAASASRSTGRSRCAAPARS
jgi:selenocysteine-specific elongation factor